MAFSGTPVQCIQSIAKSTTCSLCTYPLVCPRGQPGAVREQRTWREGPTQPGSQQHTKITDETAALEAAVATAD
ncbi:TPA: hypothetical protein ACH3X3_013816 [Trebouxia sp. C0006]